MTARSDTLTLGALVAAARARAGLTLRGLSEALGERDDPLSVQFLHDVERERRDLGTGHWKAMAAILPGLTLAGMAQARARSGRVTLDAGELTEEQRAAVAAALLREARGHGVT